MGIKARLKNNVRFYFVKKIIIIIKSCSDSPKYFFKSIEATELF